jgi:hypothetical protein
VARNRAHRLDRSRVRTPNSRSQSVHGRALAHQGKREERRPATRDAHRGGDLPPRLPLHPRQRDPALEIVQHVWPGEDPYTGSRHELLEATREALGAEARNFTFDALPDTQSLFRYEMHTLPDELDADEALIGTSTLLAAWNAATYVAQIEDERLTDAMSSSAYLDGTRAVLKKHGALWFADESYLITRTA